jgi:HD-GYP domain-containing protein (c-di-GMP phosphodiesterase class II)
MVDVSRYRSYSRLERFIQNFYSLLQTIRIHKDTHKLVIEGVAKFSKSINGCMQGDSIAIKIANDRLFVDDEMLPYNRITKNLIENMVRYFDDRGLEGLCLYEPIKQASVKDILAFLHLLDSSGQRPDTQALIINGLEENNISWVEVINKPKAEPTEEIEEFSAIDKAERRERAIKDYTYVMAAFKDVTEKVTGKGQVGMRKTVRVVQDMVKHIIVDDEVYSAISTLRVFDDYTFTHSVNVAILSMCLGKRINLSKRSLERLGTCALFHDLGKIMVPYEILNKPGKLDGSDYKLLEQHSLNSARLIVKLRASRDRKAKILLPPFEHHLKYDLSGYPQTNWKKSLTLFGRIITIADVYDAITSPRVYRKSVLSPDRALGFMLEGSGRDFDPILLKVFINILGVYPVGTLLKLDTEELALVISSSQKTGKRRPLVCLMEKGTDGSYNKGKTIDLAERDRRTGNYAREIIETYHPANFGIQPVQYIFSDN